MSRRFMIETYGCQMNKAESNALVAELVDCGWMETESAEDAELVILNTCSVRATAETRVWGRLGYYKSLKERHPHTLVLMGCMAERLREEIRRREPAVDVVVGSFAKREFKEFVRQASLPPAGVLCGDGGYAFEKRHSRTGDFKALVPIMHGCDNFCSYCIVPHVRGREVSRDPLEIESEIGHLLDQGVREITLLGQNVNSYRFRGELDFPRLLDRIAGRLEGRAWLRFLTSHPKDFSDALIDRLADGAPLCRHVHLPVQHGSDAVLAAMNRKYDSAAYLDLVRRLRLRVSDVSLTTDIMVGFPGESDEDFEAVLELLRAVRFDDAFTYYYNPREGTAAWDLGDDVPGDVKLARLERVIELQREISRANRQALLGRSVRVLVEGFAKKNRAELLARTERDEMVVFPGPPELIGNFHRVEICGLSGNTFLARRTTHRENARS